MLYIDGFNTEFIDKVFNILIQFQNFLKTVRATISLTRFYIHQLCS